MKIVRLGHRAVELQFGEAAAYYVDYSFVLLQWAFHDQHLGAMQQAAVASIASEQ